MAYLEELLPKFRKGYILGEIKGNKFHFVTPDGRVLSFAKDKPVWRKPTPDKDGYLCIGIKIICRPVRRDEVTFYEDRKDDI